MTGDQANATLDPRAHAAWRKWLSALASDSEAAIAAALVYESLADDARDAWLDALDADAPDVSVPRMALYAPLLAVEADASRRVRIAHAVAARVKDAGRPGGAEQVSPARLPAYALRGVSACGECVCVVVSPLYLDFSELLVCRYTPDQGFKSARHEPLCHVGEQIRPPELADVELEAMPLDDVVEELAHAVVADRRNGRQAPPALSHFIHLFGPMLAMNNAQARTRSEPADAR